jgi:hypothetical protein
VGHSQRKGIRASNKYDRSCFELRLSLSSIQLSLAVFQDVWQSGRFEKHMIARELGDYRNTKNAVSASHRYSALLMSIRYPIGSKRNMEEIDHTVETKHERGESHRVQ